MPTNFAELNVAHIALASRKALTYLHLGQLALKQQTLDPRYLIVTKLD
jgi:hypothetical protein